MSRSSQAAAAQALAEAEAGGGPALTEDEFNVASGAYDLQRYERYVTQVCVGGT